MIKRVALLLMLAAPVFAQQDPVLALRAASAQIATATEALAASSAAEDRGVALSASIRSLESGLASLRLALRASRAVAVKKRAAIAQNRVELGNLLATLSAVENTPEALKILHPGGAVASARAGMVLAAITPALRARAADLRAEMATINALNNLHDAALGNMQTALDTLQTARGALALALREARPPPANPADSAQNLDQLLRASKDLGALATGLDTGLGTGLDTGLPETGVPETGYETLRGRLPLPVVGTISRSFNQPNAAGIGQPGIVISAPPLSLVLAPQAGVVRFAGDFLEYGKVVILEPALGQLQIYAGFGQVYVNTADVLVSGAAMGLLGGEMPDSAEFLSQNTGVNDIPPESLYIEIRENGIPVNPMSWFTTNQTGN